MFSIGRLTGRRATKQRSADATRLCLQLEGCIDTASSDRIAQIARTILETPDGWQNAIERDADFLLQVTRVKAAMRRARAGSLFTSVADTHLRFQVSSLFLAECREYLTGDPAGRERLHLVTGSITPEGRRVLSRMQKVNVEQQTAAYVKADPMATHRQLVALTERDGHDLLAVFHSHIMRGMDCTQPSEIDIANQRRFATIGWDAIGGIFSLDGYVRFFSTCKNIDVQVYGNGAETVAVGARETIVKLSLSS